MKCQEKADVATAVIVLLIAGGLLAIIDWRVSAVILGIVLVATGVIMFCVWCSSFLYYNPTFRKWFCKDISG